ARQCDGQFHQGRAAHPGQIEDRARQPAGRPPAAGNVGDGDDPHRHHAAAAMSAAAEAQSAPSSNVPTGCEYPVIAVTAVILGAFISSLNTRITTFGLADIRGGLGLGFDEGSWLITVFGAAQMVVTPAAAWMSTVLSTRRVLLWTGAVFTVASVMPPYT